MILVCMAEYTKYCNGAHCCGYYRFFILVLKDLRAGNLWIFRFCLLF